MSYTYDVLLLLYFSNTMSTNFTYTLSLHDALPISARQWRSFMPLWTVGAAAIPLTPEQEGELLELTRWLREQGRGYDGIQLAEALAGVQTIARHSGEDIADHDVDPTHTQ